MLPLEEQDEAHWLDPAEIRDAAKFDAGATREEKKRASVDDGIDDDAYRDFSRVPPLPNVPRVYVVDFGIAKPFVENGTLIPETTTQGFKGTTQYASLRSHNLKVAYAVSRLALPLFVARWFWLGFDSSG